MYMKNKKLVQKSATGTDIDAQNNPVEEWQSLMLGQATKILSCDITLQVKPVKQSNIKLGYKCARDLS